MTDLRMAELIDEGRTGLVRAREALDRLAAGEEQAGWHPPLAALLTVVEEVVGGAAALASGEAPDGEGSEDLGAALEELQGAVAGLVERLASFSGDGSPD